MHYLWGYSLSCKWIPQPDEQLQSLQSDCWTVRERVKPDSAANPERQNKKKDEHNMWVMKKVDDKETAVRCTCAMWAAPASPIQLKAKLSDRRFLLEQLFVESAAPIRRALSSPIRLLRRDRWVSLDQRDMHSEIRHVCVCEHVLNVVNYETHKLPSERRWW